MRRYYTRGVCVYIYLYMESWWEEYKKKVTTSIMACIEWAKKPVEREREKNGGVKILKRFS